MRTTDPGPNVQTPAFGALTWALAAPGVLLVVLTAGMLTLAAVGVDILWRAETVTVPEALVLGNVAEAARLLEGGADPDAPATVRAGYLLGESVSLTPLEAAVAINRLEGFELMLDYGARIDASSWPRLYCLALRSDATIVLPKLESRGAFEALLDCGAVPLPW